MSSEYSPEYVDSYPTCVATYSTLRVFSDDFAPEEITKSLRIEPTKAFRKGDLHAQGRLHRKTNGWFYSTEKLCDSTDTRRHLDTILAALGDRIELIKGLHEKGCSIDITCYWASSGQGGPWLMPQQMLKLGLMGISIWWDIYFQEGEVASRSIK